MKIKNLLIFGIVLLLVLQIGFVLAQEEELIDICAMENPPITCGESLSLLGENFDISEEGILSFLEGGGKLILNKGKENEIVLEGTEGIEITDLSEITFTGEDAKVTINGNTFENIIPNRGGKEGYINLDSVTGKISECSFWVDEGGANYSINKGVKFYASEGAWVRYDYLEKGEGLVFLGESESSVKLGEITEPIKISGVNVEVEEGYVLQTGTLDFDGEGGIFVPKNEIAQINGVEINAQFVEGGEIFFDGKEHGGRCVSLGEENIIIQSGGKAGISMKFSETNPYIKIEEGDHVAIQTYQTTKLSIENRDDEGLIPKMIVEGDIDFENDGKIIEGFNGNFYINAASKLKETTTSPIELVLKDGKNEKVFVDNFNRLAIVPGNVEEYFADAEGIDVKFSARVKYNYLDEENIEKLIGTDIIFGEFMEHVDEGTKQMVLGRLRDYWRDLTPETQNSVSEITISDRAFIIDHKNAGAFANPWGEITFRESSNSFNLENFKHESAHARHFSLKEIYPSGGSFDLHDYPDLNQAFLESLLEDRRISEKISKTKQEFMSETGFAEWEICKGCEHENEYLEYVGPLLKEKSKALRQYSFLIDEVNILKSSENPFEKEWYSLAGNYADLKNYYDNSVNKDLSLAGLTRIYGATNIYEDVATFVEKVNEPEFFKPLLSKENEWNEIYRNKLDLLYKYKFISESEYNTILGAAGVK